MDITLTDVSLANDIWQDFHRGALILSVYKLLVLLSRAR